MNNYGAHHKTGSLICWVCHRTFNTNQGRFPVGKPTEHYIIPKQYKNRPSYKNEKELICNTCHLQINKMFTNKNLLSMTKQQLLNHPKTMSYIKWVRK